MADVIVTRHPGARDWLARQGVMGDALPALGREEVARLRPGDRVYGNLPPSLAAAVCATGARYFAIDLPWTRERVGGELSADALDALGARLREYRVAAVPRGEAPGR